LTLGNFFCDGFGLMASSVDVDRIRGFTMKDMKGLKVKKMNVEHRTSNVE